MGFGPPGLPRPFIVDGEPYTLTNPGGHILAGSVAAGNWYAVVPALVDEPGRARLLGRLSDVNDPLTLKWLWRIATGTLAEAVGLPWHVQVRLCATVHAKWVWFDGWCIRHGFSPRTEPYERIVAAAHAWLAEASGKPDEWEKVERNLWTIPPGDALLIGDQTPPWLAAEEARLFELAESLG
ncbi:hypothetical protein ACQEVF_57280 [Nonomuraea polychroma]|uniref:hypothetical protein n=1 Tax=Nonomuraea polychroma TaxID=46176 RepID=UPI003D8D2E2F